MTATEKPPRRSVGMILFGALFAVPALVFFALSVVPTVWLHLASQQWIPVQAQVLEAGLERSDADGSTTYRVTARFAYRFDGADYRGGQAGWTRAADNIGDWQEHTYRQLDVARSSQQAVTLWVSPSDPETAVYDRSLRWKLLAFKLVFVLLFGGVGVGIMWYGAGRPAAPAPETPAWLANPDWRDNRIRSNAKTGLLLLWAFSGFALLLTTPLLLSFQDELAKGNDKVWLALVIPAVVALLLAAAIKRTIEWTRHGLTPLSLDPFPGEIGGKVAGHIDTALPFASRPQGSVTLACVHRYRRQSGGESETCESTVWQDTRTLSIQPGPRGTRLRFEFNPEDGLPASSDQLNSSHLWRLSVHVNNAGPDLERSFTVPVFDRAPPQAREQTISRAGLRTPQPEPVAAPPPSIARLSPGAEGLRIDYPLFRNVGGAFVLLIFGALFGGCIPLWQWLSDGHIPLLFPIAFGIVAGLLTLAGLYTLGNSLHVRVNRREIVVRRRLYGFPFTTRIATGEVSTLNKTIGSQSRSGDKTSVSYRIQASTRSGRQICLGDSLTSASQADYVIEAIRAQFPADARPIVSSGRVTPQRVTQIAGKLEKRRGAVRLVANLIALAVFVYVTWDFVAVLLT